MKAPRKKTAGKESLSRKDPSPRTSAPGPLAASADSHGCTQNEETLKWFKMMFEDSATDTGGVLHKEHLQTVDGKLHISYPTYADFLRSALSNDMYDSAVAAGMQPVFARSAELPEFAGAITSVQQAWFASHSKVWPLESPMLAALDATLWAMRNDWLTVDGIAVEATVNAMLYFVRHFGVSLHPFRGVVAAKAAKDDSGFFGKLAAAIRYNERQKKRSHTLPRALIRAWLPLGLWMMDDSNGADVLAGYFGVPQWKPSGSKDADSFRNARAKLGLFAHPKKPINAAKWANGRVEIEWMPKFRAAFK